MIDTTQPMAAKKDPSDLDNFLVQLRTVVKDSEEIYNELYAVAETLTNEDEVKAKAEPDPQSPLRGGIIPEMFYFLHQLELINNRNHILLQRLHRMI
jgi:hypothetical protein